MHSILLKKSGSHLPRVELEEMGPSFDMEMRRVSLALDQEFKKACQQPKANKVRMCAEIMNVDM